MVGSSLPDSGVPQEAKTKVRKEVNNIFFNSVTLSFNNVVILVKIIN
ncbi:hypothetical protein IRB23SM22_03180 [Alkalibacterium sp. s-m-22]